MSPRDPRLLTAVFAGGMAGALARAALAEALPHAATAWPWATFAVNVAGAFVLGFALTWLDARPEASPYVRPFVGAGVCGALTTFSTVQVELLAMLDGGAWGLALAYAAASVAAGLAAAAVAAALARGGAR